MQMVGFLSLLKRLGELLAKSVFLMNFYHLIARIGSWFLQISEMYMSAPIEY